MILQCLKGANKQEGEQHLHGLLVIGQEEIVLNEKRGKFRLDARENFFYTEDREALEQIAQRGCGLQGQAGWDLGQPKAFCDSMKFQAGTSLVHCGNKATYIKTRQSSTTVCVFCYWIVFFSSFSCCTVECTIY